MATGIPWVPFTEARLTRVAKPRLFFFWRIRTPRASSAWCMGLLQRQPPEGVAGRDDQVTD